MTQRIEGALGDLRRYLQDEIPPSGAADALARLMAQPPEVLMQHVGAWSAEQSTAQARPVADLLLHALKKINAPAELGLLDREAMANYLDRVSTLAIRLCPAEQRNQLRSSISSMRISRGTSSGIIPIVIPGPSAAQAPLTLTEDPQSARRFSLIMDRVTQQMESGGGQGAAPDTQAVAQLLTLAAARSQTGGQLDAYLEQLRPLTGGNEGNIFVILGGAVPGWDPALLAGQNAPPPPAQVGAMEKIIDLAPDSANAMKRFRELVSAAVEKFNDGAMAATVWMLDVANDSITEKKLDIAAVDHTRAEAVEAINAAQLRKYAENKGRHAALRLVLGFFPTLRLDELFRRLRGEPKADKRRSLIGFVEAWGAMGREAALDELERELGRADLDTYYLRNLIYLLHRVLRTDDSGERELALLTRASERGQNIYVIKEAATAIGQIGSEAAVKLLTLRLAEFEAMLLRNDIGDYPAAEVQKLLDRIISGLARIGSPTALLTIARHGMKANALLGDTRARLAALSQHDLSFDAATTSVLVKALRDEIPGKLFGRLLPKKQESQICLIEALSSTQTEETEELFHEIAQRFADADIGAAAAKVLEKWSPQPQRARPDAGATLTGELEFFGLPSVMQSLADMRATGMLTLRAKDGAAAAKLVVVDGKFVNAQRAQIRGADAMYEMLERPITGTFAFVPHPAEAMKSDIAPRDIIGMVLEGVRRHDELQRIAAFVPDDLRASKGNAKPAPLEEETDAALVREVWLKASSGTPVAECERDLAADSYRVRRLIAHWIEQGALVTV